MHVYMWCMRACACACACLHIFVCVYVCVCVCVCVCQTTWPNVHQKGIQISAKSDQKSIL